MREHNAYSNGTEKGINKQINAIKYADTLLYSMSSKDFIANESVSLHGDTGTLSVRQMVWQEYVGKEQIPGYGIEIRIPQDDDGVDDFVYTETFKERDFETYTGLFHSLFERFFSVDDTPDDLAGAVLQVISEAKQEYGDYLDKTYGENALSDEQLVQSAVEAHNTFEPNFELDSEQ